MIWIILALISFLGAQLLLVLFLRKLDKHSGQKRDAGQFTYEDSYRYLDDDVIE